MSEGYGDAVPGSAADEGVVIIGMILFCPFHTRVQQLLCTLFLGGDRGLQV